MLTGLQSDDQGHAQMGVILAERLGIPHSTIIMEVQIEGDRLRVKRELEGGWFQWVSMPLPRSSQRTASVRPTTACFVAE